MKHPASHSIGSASRVKGLGEHDRIVAELARKAEGAEPLRSRGRRLTDGDGEDGSLQDCKPIVFADDAFCTLTGYAREWAIGGNCRFLQEPDYDRVEIARIRDAIEQRVPVEVQLLNRRKDVSRFWNRLFVSSSSPNCAVASAAKSPDRLERRLAENSGWCAN